LLGSCESRARDDQPLADLVNPLVVTDTGVLKPIAYDFNDRFDVGSIDSLSSDGLRSYKRQQLGRLRSLIGNALAGLNQLRDFVDWFDHCTRYSDVFSDTHAPAPDAGLVLI